MTSLTSVLTKSANSIISGALVVNVVMHKPYVIDALSRLLDPTCRGLQNWRHLAQRNDVSTDLELKFLSQERHSRSEAMFKVLAASNPSLPIGTLKCHLQDLQMNKVRDYIACLDGKCCMSSNPVKERLGFSLVAHIMK